jgi:hypothetical protein
VSLVYTGPAAVPKYKVLAATAKEEKEKEEEEGGILTGSF